MFGLVINHQKGVTCLKCLHEAPILLLRNWEAGRQRSIPPSCLFRGCVTASIHHPDMGALNETAWLDPVSVWWHICHSTQWGVWASYHLSLSYIWLLNPLLYLNSNHKSKVNSFSRSHSISWHDLNMKKGSDIDTPLTLPGSLLRHNFPCSSWG